MPEGSALPQQFCEKLLEASDGQAAWLSAAALLTFQLPHALQWWEVRDVAVGACAAAESALAATAAAGGGAGGTGGRGGFEQQGWAAVAWALLAIEGACSVAWGTPYQDRWGAGCLLGALRPSFGRPSTVLDVADAAVD